MISAGSVQARLAGIANARDKRLGYTPKTRGRACPIFQTGRVAEGLEIWLASVSFVQPEEQKKKTGEQPLPRFFGLN